MRLTARFFLFTLLGLASCGIGQTQIEVWRGWEGRERAGRWNPTFVRASDRPPRDAIIDLQSATEGGFGTQIREHIAIAPNAGTFELYAPSHYSPSAQSVLAVRDNDSGSAIGQSPPHVSHSAPKQAEIGPNGIFIGISGKPAKLDSVRQSGLSEAGFLPPRFLPRSSIGYDSIDCLFLNQPDIDALEADQQRAILDWVRAGGSLLYTPSDGPPPHDSPLIAALPCKIGNVRVMDLQAQVLKQAGIPLRFARLTFHDLEPGPDSQPLEILSETKIIAFSKRHGLGRIVVAPIDLAAIEFDATELKRKAPAFWGPILERLVGPPPEQPKRQYEAPFYGYESESEDQQREGAAVGTLCDFLTGTHSSIPKSIPLVVLAILFVVGPIDSIVLFAHGNRPWTRTTTACWIALLAGGAIFIVQLVRPSHVECRAVRLIDQVDDAAVATTDLIGIDASGHGSDVHLSNLTNAGQWWQPAIPGLAASQEVLAQPDVCFHESDGGNEPDPIAVAAGRARFLRADRFGAGPAIVQIALSLQGPPNAPMLFGTIRNLSPQPLTNIRVRTRLGVASIPLGGNTTAAPGQVLNVNIPAAGEPFAPQKAEGQYQSYGYFGSRHQDRRIPETDLWDVVPDLSGRRSLRVDEYLNAGKDYCCIYAQTVNPPLPRTVSAGAGTDEHAFQWIRALARLK